MARSRLLEPFRADRPGRTVSRPHDAADTELLRSVAEGDRGALDELYRRHAPWLRVRLHRRSADPAVADSALQDTFVAVWRSAGKFRGEGEVGAWLWGIAVRRLIDQVRRNPRPFTLPATPVVLSAEESVLAAVEHGDLGWALDTLSVELRQVVQATVLDGLTTREAAQLLGIPAGTVKTRMMRARAQLREALT